MSVYSPQLVFDYWRRGRLIEKLQRRIARKRRQWKKLHDEVVALRKRLVQ